MQQYKMLAASVVLQAVRDVKGSDEGNRNAAIRFFGSPWGRNLCDMLGHDAGRMLDRLLEMRRKEVQRE